MKTIDLLKISDKLQTPMYLFNLDELRERVGKMQEILGEDVNICYAMKANPFLLDGLKNVAECFEVCSPGEFAICERENIPMENIILSGVNKEFDDIEYVLDTYKGKGVYTVESLNQLELLNSSAVKRNMNIEILLRVTSGNQFGINEEQIYSVVENRADYAGVSIKGIQCYSGTQKKTTKICDEEITWLADICENIKERYDYKMERIEYGPGLPINYFGADAYNNNFSMLEEFSAILDKIRDKYEITLEMGRYIAATCGYFITSVADMKTNKDQNYLIIDGGINHINYYGQAMAMKIPAYSYVSKDNKVYEGALNFDTIGDVSSTVIADELSEGLEKTTEDSLEKWTICGSLCTVADLIVKNLPVIKPQLEDRIIFRNIGAYSITEGIYLFLSRRMPLIAAYSEEKGVEVYRDMKPSDVINSRQNLL